jgi:outer membrane protein assembly factor BamB
MRKRTHVLAVLNFVAFSAAILVCACQTVVAADWLLEKIDIEIIHQTEREAIPESAGVIGDEVRILPVLKSTSDNAGELEVSIYFEDRISREVGLIGKVNIPGLKRGGIRKGVVIWDTAEMRPGYYNILATGDFESSPSLLGEVPTVKMLQEGKYIAFLLDDLGQLADPEGEPFLGLCPMGEDTGRMPEGVSFVSAYKTARAQVAHSFQIPVINLGTEGIEGLADFQPGKNGEPQLVCEYRLTGREEEDSAVEEVYKRLENTCEVIGVTKLTAGQEGKITLYFEFRLGFNVTFLGRANGLQLKLQARDEDKDGERYVESPVVYVPADKDDRLNVYSWVDLWTFPEREGCSAMSALSANEEVTLSAVALPTARELAVFHVVNHVENEKTVSRLYSHRVSITDSLNKLVKKVDPHWVGEDGEADWWGPDPAAEIVSFTGATNAAGDILLYLATADGRLHAIRDPATGDTYDETVWSNLAQIPGATASLTILKPDVVMDASGNPSRVLLGTSAGLFAFDASSGRLLWQIEDKGEVTKPPVHAPDGRIVCFASIKNLYYFSPSDAEARPSLKEDRSETEITSPIVACTVDGEETAFFARMGTLYVFNLKTEGKKSLTVCADCRITGLSVINEEETGLRIYATTRTGEIYLVERSRGEYVVKKVDREVCSPPTFRGEPMGSPAIQMDKDGNLSVFVTTKSGELRAYEGDLCRGLQVLLWPKAPENGYTDDVWIDFKFGSSDEPGPAWTPPTIGVYVDKGKGPVIEVLFVGCADGRLYAFDLTRYGRETYWRF